MDARIATAADGPLLGSVRRLTILYDERCGDCRRYAAWLARQRFRVQVELLPAGSEEARVRYPHVEPWLGRELVVVDNDARAWIGPPAFVMCLWAMDRTRAASFLASRPVIGRAANAFFRHLSKRRGKHRAARDTDGLVGCNGSDTCEGGMFS
jgi:predicted DCC family thiol-disulfide oxidoreductase YuxK